MGQSRPLFVYFCLFNTSQFKYKLIKRRWCAWIRTLGSRMKGTDKSTELWRHPKCQNLAAVYTDIRYQNADHISHIHLTGIISSPERQIQARTQWTGHCPDRAGRGERQAEAEGEAREEANGAVKISRHQRVEMRSGQCRKPPITAFESARN